MDETATVLKRGENVMTFTLHRSPVGITLSVKVHNAVEEFMRQLSGVEVQTINVNAVGRYWVPIGDKTLTAYRLSTTDIRGNEAGEVQWSLDPLGDQLLIPSGKRQRDDDGPLSSLPPPPGSARGVSGGGMPISSYGGPIVNLSFIRLVGASEGAGITFGVKGVHSLESLRDTKERIGAAFRSFYTRYLMPVDLTAIVSTRELQL